MIYRVFFWPIRMEFTIYEYIIKKSHRQRVARSARSPTCSLGSHNLCASTTATTTTIVCDKTGCRCSCSPPRFTFCHPNPTHSAVDTLSVEWTIYTHSSSDCLLTEASATYNPFYISKHRILTSSKKQKNTK